MSANFRFAFQDVKTWLQSMLRNWFPRLQLIAAQLFGWGADRERNLKVVCFN